jgi:hypothetical protein
VICVTTIYHITSNKRPDVAPASKRDRKIKKKERGGKKQLPHARARALSSDKANSDLLADYSSLPAKSSRFFALSSAEGARPR